MKNTTYHPQVGDKIASLKNRGLGKVVAVSTDVIMSPTESCPALCVEFTGEHGASAWFYPHRAWFRFSEIGSEIAPVAELGSHVG